MLRAEIDWKHLAADTPPAVRRLLERCLQRDLKRRLRDIGDAWIEIDAPMELAARAPAPPPEASRPPWIAAGAAALIAVAAVGWALLHKPAQPPRPLVRWAYKQEKPLAALSFSHDGSRLAFNEFVGSTSQIAVRRMSQIEPKVLAALGTTALPVFSPDGQWVAFVGPGPKIEKIPVSGGTAIALCDASASPYYGLAWGDDGNIVFVGANGLMRISSAGGTPEQLTAVDAKKG